MRDANAQQWGAWLHLDGWEGRTKQPVIVVAETRTRYRITPMGPDPVRLAGRSRLLGVGGTALVPKYAITRRHPPDA